MHINVGRLFGQFSHILGICPCCGNLFRLGDARPYFQHKPQRSILDEIEEQERRLVRAIELLEEREARLRELAAAAGARQARKRLKRIDRAFSGTGLDPQDVKVIFDPVEYVVFDGLNRDKLRRIVLMAHPPKTRAHDTLLRSIDRAIQMGNIAFKTMRIMPDFSLALK